MAFLFGWPLIPARFRVALEFRHGSWFEGAVFELLRRHNAALCWADMDEGGPLVSGGKAGTAGPTGPNTDDEGRSRVATADWGYLRLRREGYDADALRTWVQRVGGQGWSDVYVFFKHEDEAAGPRFARQFVELLGA